MKRQHYVLFVPGLGDQKIFSMQRLVPRTWRKYGVRGRCFCIGWTNKKFEPRYAKLLAKIDELSAKGHTVSLIGSSAGATAVLLAFLDRPEKINGVVTICGKIHNADNVRREVYDVNPAFEQSLKKLQPKLKNLTSEMKQRIHCIYSDNDELIPMKEAMIEGADNILVGGLGHVPTIAVQIKLHIKNHLSLLKQLAP